MTHVVTEPVDQSALVGIINRLNSLGLPLLAVGSNSRYGRKRKS